MKKNEFLAFSILHVKEILKEDCTAQTKKMKGFSSSKAFKL